MYKEIDMQRERIQTIEESLKELLYKNIEDMSSDDDELSLPPAPTIIPIPEKMGIKIELPNKILDNKNNKDNKDNKNNKNNKNNNDNNEQDTVLKTQSEESLKKDDKLDTDNKHLEIYSNDNENAQETSISDSLIKQKTNVNIDLDSSSEIISTESEESSSSMNETSNSEKLEKLDLKIEKLESSSEKKEKLESSSEKKDELDELNELNEVLKELKFEDINEQKLDLTNLLKLKVPEIQEMAKKENISLDKKINGVNKKKTKQELAEELVNKKN
jgi:hypothetical protein